MRLGELAEFRNGLNYTDADLGKGLAIVGVTDFQDHVIANLSALQEIGLSAMPKDNAMVHKNDILFVRSNGNRELIGRSLFVKHSPQMPTSHSGFTIRCRFLSSICYPRFYAYLFRGPIIRRTLSAQGGGTSISNLNQGILSALVVPVPPMWEQERIASILSAFDDLIENNTRRITILEEMARRIFEEWFVHFRAPGCATLPRIDTPLGPVPEGWEAVRLDEITNNFDRLRKPISKMLRSERQGPYPYYGAAKIVDHIDEYLFDGEYLLIAEDGSVITKEGYPVLQLVDGKFWVNNHTHVLTAKPPFSLWFIYLVLSRYSIVGHVTGAAQPKITQENLNRILCIRPPMEVLTEFEKLAAPIFRLCSNFNKQNHNLRAQRDLLLPQLISGEIDVSVAPALLEAAE